MMDLNLGLIFERTHISHLTFIGAQGYQISMFLAQKTKWNVCMKGMAKLSMIVLNLRLDGLVLIILFMDNL